MIDGEDLDLERTMQATERTLLAYIRTSLTVFAVGATFIKFFDSIIFEMIGWIFIPIAIGIFLFGLRHYRKLIKHLSWIKKNNHS